MTAEVIARMRERIARARRVINMAHDPEMIRMLEEMITEAEADIAKMETVTPTIEIKDFPTQR